MGHQPGHLFARFGKTGEDENEPGNEKETEKQILPTTPPTGKRPETSPQRGDSREKAERCSDKLILRIENEEVEPGLIAATDVVLSQPVEQCSISGEG